MQKFFAWVSILSLLLQLTSSIFLYSPVLAEEPTPTPTSNVEVTPTPTPTETPVVSPDPTPEPSATPEVTPSPTPDVSPTPEASIEPSPSPEVTPTPEPSPADVQPTDNPNVESNAPPTTPSPESAPEPTVTPSPEPQENGKLSAAILKDTKADSIDELDLNFQGEGSAAISTDKLDYAPTDTVLVTGTGFLAQKTYTIIISSSDEPAVTHEDSVTADAEGNLFYSYQLDGTYRPNYKVEVKDGDRVVASTTFTDQQSTQLDWVQCQNDADNNNVSDIPMCDWSTGSINSNNSVIAEGNSTPTYPPNIPGHVNYRAIFEGLVAGTYEMIINYEFSKGGAIAFDFLTTNYGVSDSNLCDDLPVGFSTSDCNTLVSSSVNSSTFPLEAETVDASNGGGAVSLRQGVHDTVFAAFSPRLMKIYGGTITSIVNLPRVGSDTGDSKDFVKVTFTKSSGDTSPIIATWGGHFAISSASPIGYGLGNGAGSISGAPFHMRMDNLARTTDPVDTNVVGGGDRSVQPGAILPPGTITIIKNADPNDAQDFAFSTTGTGLSAFTLDDDADITLSNTRTFVGLDAGTYTVTETPVTGWTLGSVSCQSDGTGSTNSPITNGVSITLVSGEHVTCTFTNTQQNGTLTVNKVLSPSQDPGLFNLQIDGQTQATNVGNGGTTGGVSVSAGSHNVGETAGTDTNPANYTTVISGDCDSQGNVSVPAGGSKTCTITNTRNTGTIIVHKQIDLNGDGIYEVTDDFLATNTYGFIWGLDSEAPSRSFGTSQTSVTTNVIHTVTENTVPGYHYTGTYGVGESQLGCNGLTTPVQPAAAVFLFPNPGGNTRHITLCNAQDLGTLTVYKQDEQGNPQSGVTIAISGTSSDSKQTDQNGNAVFSNIPTGPYTVTEPPPTNYHWQSTSGDCSNANPASVEVTANGQSCTFTNARDTGRIIGVKFNDLDGDGNRDAGEPLLSSWTMELKESNEQGAPVIDTAVTDANGYSFEDVPTGNYFVCEVEQANWTQTYPNGCWGVQVTTQGTLPTSVDFGNFKDGHISGHKWNDLDGDGNWDKGEPTIEGWRVYLDRPEGGDISDLTDLNGYYYFGDLGPGTYRVYEEHQTGWTQTAPGGGEYVINMTSDAEGLDNPNYDFGNFQLGSISGHKFNDLDGDGNEIPDVDEPYIAGWEITLEKQGEGWEFVGSVLTDGDGNWSFTGLTPGTYRVVEEDRPGWTHTTFSSGIYGPITLSSGSAITEVNFGNRGNITVYGHKYEDMNMNGEVDGGDQEIDNWRICLSGTTDLGRDVDECIYTETETVDTYYFYNLEPGNYTLTEEERDGWVANSPTSVEIELTGEENGWYGPVNFLNYRPGKITACKYEDLDGNRERDEGEGPLSGVTMNLYRWEWVPIFDGFLDDILGYWDWVFDSSQETEENGCTTFGNLTHGDYKTSENVPEGYEQTWPVEPDYYTREVSSGSDFLLEFLNYPVTPILTITKENDATGDRHPGDSVLYTLTVTATQSAVNDVFLTDLLPDGFKYRSGSCTAISTERGSLACAPTYASPGVWDLGDMKKDEVVTLTYIADIDGNQDPGLYKDLAWASGKAGCRHSYLVLAVAEDPGFVSENFVGTEVNVVKDQQSGVGYNVENKVLGASTSLPATGAQSFWLTLALIMAVLGLGSIVTGVILKKKYA